MSYEDFMAARMLLAEEVIGVRVRQAGYAEDRAMAKGLQAVRDREARS